MSLLIRLPRPSTAPELQGRVSPAMTASWSRSMPAARVWEIIAPDGVEPLRQPLALALGEHPREGPPDVCGEGVEFGAVDQDGLKPEMIGIREGIGAPEGPPATTRRTAAEA
ncbi:hypothetical protein ACFW6S_23580 [Streptomyces sp. NPDC058740]|uniref:hypothetical protein n=1 Tax=Streptomyces sp. NPDC058740 TaxID=3346619 RepID=UPI003686C44D